MLNQADARHFIVSILLLTPIVPVRVWLCMNEVRFHGLELSGLLSVRTANVLKISFGTAGGWPAGIRHHLSSRDVSLLFDTNSVTDLLIRNLVQTSFHVLVGLVIQKNLKMDFLKRVVPPILPGDVVLDTRDSFPESSPRLLKMRRLSWLSSEKIIDEKDGIHFCHSNYDRHPHQQLGKVKMHSFQFFKIF